MATPGSGLPLHIEHPRLTPWKAAGIGLGVVAIIALLALLDTRAAGEELGPEALGGARRRRRRPRGFELGVNWTPKGPDAPEDGREAWYMRGKYQVPDAQREGYEAGFDEAMKVAHFDEAVRRAAIEFIREHGSDEEKGLTPEEREALIQSLIDDPPKEFVNEIRDEMTSWRGPWGRLMEGFEEGYREGIDWADECQYIVDDAVEAKEREKDDECESRVDDAKEELQEELERDFEDKLAEKEEELEKLLEADDKVAAAFNRGVNKGSKAGEKRAKKLQARLTERDEQIKLLRAQVKKRPEIPELRTPMREALTEGEGAFEAGNCARALNNLVTVEAQMMRVVEAEQETDFREENRRLLRLRANINRACLVRAPSGPSAVPSAPLAPPEAEREYEREEPIPTERRFRHIEVEPEEREEFGPEPLDPEERRRWLERIRASRAVEPPSERYRFIEVEGPRRRRRCYRGVACR